MEYFKKSLQNSVACEVNALEDLIPDDNKFKKKQYPANLSFWLSTTLVVKLTGKKSRGSLAQHVLDRLDENIFKGKLNKLLHKYDLTQTWNTALRDVVLVADRQVTHYIQVSGPPLTQEKSILDWTVTGQKREVFQENHYEENARLHDKEHQIAHRESLKPKKATEDLEILKKSLNELDHGFLQGVFRRWIDQTKDKDKVLEILSSILKQKHPVRRTLDNFLKTERNSELLSTLFLDRAAGTSAQKIAVASGTLFDKCVVKNLIFESSRRRLKNFVQKYMQTRIDHGSIDHLEVALRKLTKQPKWVKKLGFSRHGAFLQCLCVLLVRLVVLNIHAVFLVASRGSSPKIPEYARKEVVSMKRKECLRNLVESNLEPTDAVAQGRMMTLPKASPFEFRPVFCYIRKKPSFTVPLKTCLQSLKSESQAKLEIPVVAMNSALALQKLSELRLRGKLYFVKGDVQDCYGSVDLEALKIRLIESWPTTGKALEFQEVDLPVRPLSRKNRRIHLIEDRLFRRPLCDGRLSILMPTGKVSVWEPNRELEVLLSWIRNIVVEIEGSTYRFRRGVPQGATFSSIIADLYLALHVDQLFGRFRNDLAVFRTMDDYFAVSTSRDTAQRCLQIFKNTQLHEGLVFSESKFMTNWKLDSDGDEEFLSEPFTYCGEQLDPTSGQFKLTSEYKEFVSNVRCFRKDLHGKPMKDAFKYLLKSSYWGYPMGLFSYDKKNLPSLFRNIFEAATNNALRFRSYVDDTNLCTNSLLRFVRIHRLVFTRHIRTAVFKQSLGSLVLSRRCLLYLHAQAFKRVLALKKTRYRELLDAISKNFGKEMDIKSMRHIKLLQIASRKVV